MAYVDNRGYVRQSIINRTKETKVSIYDQIMGYRTISDEPDMLAIIVEALNPGKTGNRYYVEIVRVCGNRYYWVELWHSAQTWTDANIALQKLAI